MITAIEHYETPTPLLQSPEFHDRQAFRAQCEEHGEIPIRYAWIGSADDGDAITADGLVNLARAFFQHPCPRGFVPAASMRGVWCPLNFSELQRLILEMSLRPWEEPMALRDPRREEPLE